MKLALLIGAVFAAAFAVFEVFGRWILLPCHVLACRPRILGLSPYHFLIVIPMFVLISLVSVKAEGRSLKSWSSMSIAGSIVLYIAVLEDLLYFTIGGYRITPGIFTTQYGYVDVFTLVIPIWYLVASGCAIILSGLGLVAEQRHASGQGPRREVDLRRPNSGSRTEPLN